MKNIKVNIPDGYVIDTESSDLEKGIITFKKEESKYPMELVHVFKNDNWNLSIGDWHKYETFIRLVETCKEWNRIDGFKATGLGFNEKMIARRVNNDIGILYHCSGMTSHPLVFKDHETAELFLETFREEIELVKDLI